MVYHMYLTYAAGILLAMPALIGGLMAGPPIEEFEESGDGQSRKGLALVGILVGCGCLVIVLPVVVIAVLLLLGPAIGNVFSRISSGLY
jgi:hypothetical protein